jgi:GNAT superfamily N-acetyltransferase
MAAGAIIRVRAARDADVVSIVQVVRDSITRGCVADHRNDPELLAAWLENKTLQHVRTWLSDAENHLLVAESNSICGVGLLHRSGELRLLYVAPDGQRRGVGRALLTQLEEHSRHWGLTRLQLSSTATARAFYEAMGYFEAGESSWRGIACHKFEKALTSSS